MAIKNNTYYESLVKDNPFTELAQDPAIDKNGMLHAPKGPGIGYETLWAEKGAPKELAKFLKA
jgi:L-alanine-DL-glutamate epimerase-like enolase superfamily enzyme